MTETRTYPQRARERIAGTKIIDRLVKHINGEIELSPSQVAAARILLNKVLPDLKSMELQATIAPLGPSIHQLSDEELLTIAAGALNVVPMLPVEKTVSEVPAIAAPEKQTG